MLGAALSCCYHFRMSEINGKVARWFGARRQARLPDLGERELAALEVLWAAGSASAQAVQRDMAGPEVSLSTVQSTLERLHRKGLLRRVKRGRAYEYSALFDRTRLIGALLRDLAEDVAGGELAPMLSGFLDYVTGEAPELRPEVERALGLPTAPGKRDDG